MVDDFNPEVFNTSTESERIRAIPITLLVSAEEEASREALCRSCEFLGEFCGVGVCKKCGCFVRINRKLSMGVCPLGKWVPQEAI